MPVVLATQYPFTSPGADQLRFLVGCAALAPSTHSTQPWRFRIVDDDEVEVWADATRAIPRIDPVGRQRLISCGAALLHVRIGLRRFGWRDEVDYLPEPGAPELVARVRRGGMLRPPPRDVELFDAIPRRRPRRGPFLPRPVSAEHAAALIREAAIEGAWMEQVQSDDGLAGALLVEVRRSAEPRWWREPALARSPMLAVLGTDLDEPRDWIAAGEAMEAALLRATCLGMTASFLFQAVEVPTLRGSIGRAAGRGGFAQLILRFG
jgi:nitroreductase